MTDQGQGAVPRVTAPLPGNGAGATPRGNGPFRSAADRPERVNVMLWGGPGSGKTTLALKFPNPVVIDLEGGTRRHGKHYRFDVLPANTLEEVESAIAWLRSNRHDYRTLVVDPVTVLWDIFFDRWCKTFLARKKGGKGHRGEFYEPQFNDWNVIKTEWRLLFLRMVACDMNLICIARAKEERDSDAKVIGQRADVERSMPYLSDSVIRLWHDAEGYWCEASEKDRESPLPSGKFRNDYDIFARAFGEATISRDAAPVALIRDEQKERYRILIETLGVAPDKEASALGRLGALSVDDLTERQASEIIERMEAAVAAKVTPAAA